MFARAFFKFFINGAIFIVSLSRSSLHGCSFQRPGTSRALEIYQLLIYDTALGYTQYGLRLVPREHL